MISPMVVAALPKNILLVEDNIDTQRCFVKLMKLGGHNCTVSGTVREAIDNLTQAVPDWIVLDLNLPDGNGIEVLRHVKNNNLETKVCICSAAYDCTEVLKLHPTAYMPKPINVSALLSLIGG